MTKVKDLYFIIEEYLTQGLDESEIAGKLNVPVDMVEEFVKMIDENNFEEDMETDPYR
jgi:orotate phosphoribosyltransferase-like protein